MGECEKGNIQEEDLKTLSSFDNKSFQLNLDREQFSFNEQVDLSDIQNEQMYEINIEIYGKMRIIRYRSI